MPEALIMRQLVALVLIILGVAVVGSLAEIQLKHMSTVYLPYTYRGRSARFAFNKDAAEQSAYDPERQIIYTVGNDLLHVIDVSNPKKPKVVYHTTLRGGELTDIETCGGYVAVAFDNKVHPLDGRVFVYKAYDFTTQQMTLVHNIAVGALPDMLQFTKDCRKMVVALEGELRMVDGKVVDPEGGVAVINFRGQDPSGHVHVKLANFTRFNDLADEYVRRGVRWAYHGEGTDMKTTFAQDLEPEYVAINPEGTLAYIILEENNAVATVDINQGEILEIYPLGSKSWEGLGLDASDKDGGINLRSWPVYGLYQPDGVKHVTIGGRGYLITANEGEEKEYEMPDFPFEYSDGQPGKYFVENDLLDECVSDELRNALADDSQLGRLRLSTLDGKDPVSGKFNKLHTYGGRSFSLWDEKDLSLVYDSRDEVERRIAQTYPDIFSSDGQAKKGGPESNMDSRSRKKGPETETMDIGEVNGKTVLFIATERPGVILIYSLPYNDFITPVFESAHYAGGQGKNWKALYRQRKTRDIDPEDIKFVSANKSPNHKPMLIVSGTTSGTVSLYQVKDTESCNPNTYDSDEDVSILEKEGVLSRFLNTSTHHDFST